MKSTTKTKKKANPMTSEEWIEIVFLLLGIILFGILYAWLFLTNDEEKPRIAGHENDPHPTVVYDQNAINITKEYNVNYSQVIQYLADLDEIKRQFKTQEEYNSLPEIAPVMVERVGILDESENVDISAYMDSVEYFATTYQPEDLGPSENIYDKARFVYGTDYNYDENVLNVWKFKYVALTPADLEFIMQSPVINRPVLLDRYGVVKQYPDKVSYSDDYLTLIENEVGF